MVVTNSKKLHKGKTDTITTGVFPCLYDAIFDLKKTCLLNGGESVSEMWMDKTYDGGSTSVHVEFERAGFLRNAQKQTSVRHYRDYSYQCTGLINYPIEKFIYSCKDGRCLDATLDVFCGAGAQLWTWHGGKNQRWYIKKIEGNTFTIRSINSGKYLDVAGYSMDNNATVHQWNPNNSENQMWEINQIANDISSIRVVHSGKFLTALDGGDGRKIVQADWNGDDNQK